MKYTLGSSPVHKVPTESPHLDEIYSLHFPPFQYRLLLSKFPSEWHRLPDASTATRGLSRAPAAPNPSNAANTSIDTFAPTRWRSRLSAASVARHIVADLVTRHEKTLHGPDRLPSTATAMGTATTATTTTSSSATASAGTSYNNPFLAPFPPLDSPDSLRPLPVSGPSSRANVHSAAALQEADAMITAAAAAFQEADAMIDPALFDSILHQTPSADTASPFLSESTTSNDASQQVSTAPGAVKRQRLMTRGTTTSISSDPIDTSRLPHAAYGSHPLP